MIKNPTHLSDDDRRVPDLQTFMGIDHDIVDVAIVHPGAPSYARRAALPLRTARNMERIKKNKYRDLGIEHKAKIVPFVVETYGAPGEEATKFVRRMAAFSEDQGVGLTRRQVFQQTMQRVAVAVQKGNARMVQACLQRANHARQPVLRRADLQFAPRRPQE